MYFGQHAVEYLFTFQAVLRTTSAHVLRWIGYLDAFIRCIVAWHLLVLHVQVLCIYSCEIQYADHTIVPCIPSTTKRCGCMQVYVVSGVSRYMVSRVTITLIMYFLLCIVYTLCSVVRCCVACGWCTVQVKGFILAISSYAYRVIQCTTCFA